MRDAVAARKLRAPLRVQRVPPHAREARPHSAIRRRRCRRWPRRDLRRWSSSARRRRRMHPGRRRRDGGRRRRGAPRRRGGEHERVRRRQPLLRARLARRRRRARRGDRRAGRNCAQRRWGSNALLQCAQDGLVRKVARVEETGGKDEDIEGASCFGLFVKVTDATQCTAHRNLRAPLATSLAPRHAVVSRSSRLVLRRSGVAREVQVTVNVVFDDEVIVRPRSVDFVAEMADERQPRALLHLCHPRLRRRVPAHSGEARAPNADRTLARADCRGAQPRCARARRSHRRRTRSCARTTPRRAARAQRRPIVRARRDAPLDCSTLAGEVEQYDDIDIMTYLCHRGRI